MSEERPPAHRLGRYAEALKDEYHLLGWCGLIVGALLADAPSVLLLAGLPLEAAYLAFVPNSTWFRERLRQKRLELEAHSRAQQRASLLPSLPRDYRERYADLCRARHDISRHGDPALPRHHRRALRQLDYLLDQFLVFAGKSLELREHLLRLAGEVGPVAWPTTQPPVDQLEVRAAERFEQELETTLAELEREADPTSNQILAKNADILRRSRVMLGDLSRLLRNLERQMVLVENTFTLVQSQAKQGAPVDVLEEVAALVEQSDALAQAVRDFAPVEQTLVRLGAGRD